VLSDLQFKIQEGERVIVLGVNGSGKSTLLKVLDGLLFPQDGCVRYQGTVLSSAVLDKGAFRRQFRSEVAMLFQNVDAMLFNPTGFGELAFGPRQLGLPDLEERVRKWADTFGV
jgi:cobalt/nickel transport system ATP-binding protein